MRCLSEVEKTFRSHKQHTEYFHLRSSSLNRRFTEFPLSLIQTCRTSRYLTGTVFQLRHAAAHLREKGRGRGRTAVPPSLRLRSTNGRVSLWFGFVSSGNLRSSVLRRLSPDLSIQCTHSLTDVFNPRGLPYMTSAVVGGEGSPKSRQKERGCANSVCDKGGLNIRIFGGRHTWKLPLLSFPRAYYRIEQKNWCQGCENGF